MVPEPEDAWASYQRTVVEIMRPGEGSLRVWSAPQADEDRMAVARRTARPPPDCLGSGLERPGHDVNRVRQAALEADLASLSVPLFVAAGVDPVTGRREEGVAVRHLAESDVLALGVRYGQDAVFAWTPAAWAVVACRGGRRVTTGWFLETATTPDFASAGHLTRRFDERGGGRRARSTLAGGTMEQFDESWDEAARAGARL